ncbi:MAG: diguanylate cyclase [Nitrospirae bacterium]|nr:diguanylate cyclase [Nitrospirota bacterium]
MTEDNCFNDKEIHSISLFKSVRLKSIEGILKKCAYRVFYPGDVIIAEGEINSFVYLLLSGRVRVHVDSVEDEPLNVYDGGEIFGELSVIDKRPTSASIVADVTCRTIVLSEADLFALVSESHSVCKNLLGILAHRLRHGTALISKSSYLQRRYDYYASIDVLTGLYNRQWLMDTLDKLMNKARSREIPLVILMADADHFREYAGSYGQTAAERALYVMAVVFVNSLRKTDFVVRMDDDKFVIVLPGTDVTNGCYIAERLRKTIMESPVTLYDGSQLTCPGISIGVACMEPGQDASSLLANALEARMRAKAKGRNRFST